MLAPLQIFIFSECENVKLFCRSFCGLFLQAELRFTLSTRIICIQVAWGIRNIRAIFLVSYRRITMGEIWLKYSSFVEKSVTLRMEMISEGRFLQPRGSDVMKTFRQPARKKGEIKKENHNRRENKIQTFLCLYSRCLFASYLNVSLNA